MPRTVKKDANLQPGTPLKPTNLSDRASIEWDRLTSELRGAQILVSTAHRALLSLAATIAADIGQAWEVVKATDVTPALERWEVSAAHRGEARHESTFVHVRTKRLSKRPLL